MYSISRELRHCTRILHDAVRLVRPTNFCTCRQRLTHSQAIVEPVLPLSRPRDQEEEPVASRHTMEGTIS
jgi:hypothetical protein